MLMVVVIAQVVGENDQPFRVITVKAHEKRTKTPTTLSR
jgi:hypothetical protein